MNRFSLSRILLTFLLLSLVFIFSPFKVDKTNDVFLDNKTICKALVENVTFSNSNQNSKIKVLISEGKYKGKEFILDNTLVVNDSELALKPNDFVQISIQTDSNNLLSNYFFFFINNTKWIE